MTTPNRHAFVTLTTNDSYAMGALALASSLRDSNTTADLVCLTTAGNLSTSITAALQRAFDRVHEVTLIDSHDSTILNLLQRPELGVTLTKLHCWRLLDYHKCVFLDADTLVLRNCDELFDMPELTAAPDVGWPDCFNSGMFVYCPSEERFQELLRFVSDNGSFDGGDQGMLNEFFPNWNRVSFTYNTSMSTVYSYLPAFKQYEKDIKIVHFLGAAMKPWNLNYNEQTQTLTSMPSQFKDFSKYASLWWRLFQRDTLPVLRQQAVTEASGSTKVEAISSGVAAIKIVKPKRTVPSQDAWEENDIDYMGIDSFKNILKQIDTTVKGNQEADSSTHTEDDTETWEEILAPPENVVADEVECKAKNEIPQTPSVHEVQSHVNDEKRQINVRKGPKPGSFEAWLYGEIDYMGIDAFDNILKHLWQTVTRKPSRKKEKNKKPVAIPEPINAK